MKIVFWISAVILFWVYLGYPFILFILTKIKGKEKKLIPKKCYPKVSIIIAAHNEEENIKGRIENCLSLDYPKEKIEIIVASDGSTDKTVEIAAKYKDKRVKVLDFKTQRGRALVHNDAVKVATGEILIFTDASTIFEEDFILKIISVYNKYPRVGCVVGKLEYLSLNSAVSISESTYFKLETFLRELENQLGIYATGTGACMAILKDIYQFLDPREDIDNSIPLYTVLKGYKVYFESRAKALEIPTQSIKSELRARIRMTSKGIISFIKRWGLKGWIKYPVISFGLLSHKILRWFTLFFMVGLFIGNIFLTNRGWFYKFIFGGQILFYGIATLGFVAELIKKKNPPIASIISSFCVAALGMGIGVIKGIFGEVPTKY